jgi:hypothetical protein
MIIIRNLIVLALCLTTIGMYYIATSAIKEVVIHPSVIHFFQG